MTAQPLATAPTGTAAWALEIARPLVAAWDPASTVRVIHGRDLGLDGLLLPEGVWKVVAWSQPKNRQLRVSVRADGRCETAEGDPPGASRDLITDVANGPLGVAPDWPSWWIDSPEAVRVAQLHQPGPPLRVIGASFNEWRYDKQPNEAVWAVIFDVGDGHFISLGGAYLKRP